MFDTFYQLSGLPFLLTPDSRFFFGSSGHSRAIAHLVYGLTQQEGFIVITGEVTTQVSGDDLLRLAMAGFGLGETAGTDEATLLRQFEHMLQDQHKQGRRCLLAVDEVQNLSLAAIEELRMLSNITVDGRASLQTILLGQPQFRPILAGKDAEQLRQRVLASCHLGPMTEAETRGYIEHRLRLVGWRNDPGWNDDAFTAVYRNTGGIPRRINTLCSRALLFGALEETHVISAGIVDATAEELRRDLGHGPEPAAFTQPSGTRAETDDLARRIGALEGHASRQETLSRRILGLLEAGVTGDHAGIRT